jgi:hypothetical protein
VKRIAVLVLAGCVPVFFALLLVDTLQSFWYSQVRPPTQSDMQTVSGELASVSQCASGRRSTYVFTVRADPYGPMSLDCHRGIRNGMSELIGQNVVVLYRMEQSLWKSQRRLYRVSSGRTVFIDRLGGGGSALGELVLFTALCIFAALFAGSARLFWRLAQQTRSAA